MTVSSTRGAPYNASENALILMSLARSSEISVPVHWRPSSSTASSTLIPLNTVVRSSLLPLAAAFFALASRSAFEPFLGGLAAFGGCG